MIPFTRTELITLSAAFAITVAIAFFATLCGVLDGDCRIIEPIKLEAMR